MKKTTKAKVAVGAMWSLWTACVGIMVYESYQMGACIPALVEWTKDTLEEAKN